MANATPIRLEVRKDDGRFIGDLVWSDDTRWIAWQVFRTLKGLTENARCTFGGPIIRVREGGGR